MPLGQLLGCLRLALRLHQPARALPERLRLRRARLEGRLGRLGRLRGLRWLAGRLRGLWQQQLLWRQQVLAQLLLGLLLATRYMRRRPLRGCARLLQGHLLRAARLRARLLWGCHRRSGQHWGSLGQRVGRSRMGPRVG
ncbi:hypothetical protein F6B41_27585 [Microbacterium lushaniae]|nr:hypothetical protein F6B41_27585 [Microbacterium lushaniae]